MAAEVADFVIHGFPGVPKGLAVLRWGAGQPGEILLTEHAGAIQINEHNQGVGLICSLEPGYHLAYDWMNDRTAVLADEQCSLPSPTLS